VFFFQFDAVFKHAFSKKKARDKKRAT